MEYLYIIGIIGYYLYQAYSKSKKDKAKEVVAEAPPKTSKKKSFLEELLEEMDKMNKKSGKPAPAPVPKTTPLPVTKAEKKKPVKKVSSLDTIQDRIDSYVYNDQQIAEGIRSTIDEVSPVLPDKDKAPSRFRLRGTDLSARDAVVAQVIMERKF